jgi:hypothetical protein
MGDCHDETPDDYDGNGMQFAERKASAAHGRRIRAARRTRQIWQIRHSIGTSQTDVDATQSLAWRLWRSVELLRRRREGGLWFGIQH